MVRRDPLATAQAALREFALAFPESKEDFPWGELAIKVKGKIFATLALHKGNLYISTKLPVSASAALEMPFAAPTGYGLGKHGWITSTFGPKDRVPLDLLREWIDESYRAVAPKSALAKFEEQEAVVKQARSKTKKSGS